MRRTSTKTDQFSGDEEDPNSSAAETHAQDGREVFEGVARLCKVETSVVTRCLACKSFFKKANKVEGHYQIQL